MPNGDDHRPCPSLTEMAAQAEQEIKRLRQDNTDLRDKVQLLEGEKGSLLATIKMLKGDQE